MSNISPDPNLTTAAIKAINSLGGSVDSLVGKFEQMAEAQTRARRTVRWVIVSIVFDVLLSLTTAGFGYVAIHADHSSKSNRNTLVASCNTANVTRLNEIAIWRVFLSTPDAIAMHGPLAKDPIYQFVEKTYAPHVCVLLPDGTLPQPKDEL